MFDPNSITPPEELMEKRVLDTCLNWEEDYKFFARWGAARAVEALRHQWPEPITDRLPTEDDADENGFVQYLGSSGWQVTHWHDTRRTKGGWLHIPNWRPKPEPTPKQKARALLDAVNIDSDRFTAEQVELLRQVVESAPEATP
jgi:hypothetical protein